MCLRAKRLLSSKNLVGLVGSIQTYNINVANYTVKSYTGFQPFSYSDEQQLVNVINSRPKHVARYIRQLATQKRRNLLIFKRAVTWLISQIDEQLSKDKIGPNDVIQILEGVLRECCQLKLESSAHELFRAAMEWKQYGVHTNLKSLRYLFDTFRQKPSGNEMMLDLALELQNDIHYKSLAIAAFLFSKSYKEADKLIDTIDVANFTTMDYLPIIEGYTYLEESHFEKLMELLNSAIIHKSTNNLDLDTILSHALQGTKFNKNINSICSKILELTDIKLTDAAIAQYISMKLANAKNSGDIYNIEANVKKQFNIKELGLSSSTAIVIKNAEILEETQLRSDELMKAKVEQLQVIIETHILNDEMDAIESQHINSLIKGYGILGEYQEMRSLFENFKKIPGLVHEETYEEILLWYADSYNIKEIIQLKEQMAKDGSYISPKAYQIIVNALGKFFPRIINEIYIELQERGVRITHLLFTALCKVFSALKNEENMNQLLAMFRGRFNSGDYELITAPNIGVLLDYYRRDDAIANEIIEFGERRCLMENETFQCVLLTHYIEIKKEKKITELLEQIPVKTPNILNCLLQYYSDLKLDDKCNDIIARIRDTNTPLNEKILTTISYFYAKTGQSDSLRETLAELKGILPASNKDKYYGIAIPLLQNLNNGSAIAMLWQEINSKSRPVSMVVYNRFLDYFLSTNDMVYIQQVLDHMMKFVPPNPVTTTTVIDMLGKQGRLDDMEALLDEMIHSAQLTPTTVTFHAAMTAFARVGNTSKIEALRTKFHRCGLKEDMVTYNILFTAYAKAKRFETIKDIRKERKEKGIEMDIIGFKTLISIFGKAKRKDDLEEIITEMKKDKVDLNQSHLRLCIASSYSYLKDIDSTLEYLKDINITELGTKLVENLVLIYSRLKLNEELEKVVFSANNISARSLNICLDVFARENLMSQFDKIHQFTKSKGYTITPNIATSISTSFLRNGHIELAQSILNENMLL